MTATTLDERFWTKVVRDPAGCWRWHGPRTTRGYGQIVVSGKARPAHRLAYELLVGPIPDGLEIDHLCHNAAKDCLAGDACVHRRCVNPAHLEPVTHRANVLRGKTLAATNAKKTRCPQGHPYSPENTRVKAAGWRVCRTCDRAKSRETWQRKRLAGMSA